MLLSELTVYHGTSKHHETTLKPPIFVTTDTNGANWFAQRDGAQGVILRGDLNVKRALDVRGAEGFAAMVKLARSAGLTVEEDPYFQCDEISEYSQYDGGNSLDLVYVPAFVKALKKAGYDSVHASDVLESSEIETYVLFSPAQFIVQGSE